MVFKHRYTWGYRTLVAEVSDSIHLRRFCRIALCERVCDESTVRKLTRRIGEQTVNDITRELIEAAVRTEVGEGRIARAPGPRRLDARSASRRTPGMRRSIESRDASTWRALHQSPRTGIAGGA